MDASALTRVHFVSSEAQARELIPRLRAKGLEKVAWWGGLIARGWSPTRPVLGA